ncbi:MAG: squalene--hopene cyclase [Gammaproteobacteria bacterium]|nr:squalene--hopene cyclase [Gammaproteobacteria bacterium]
MNTVEEGLFDASPEIELSGELDRSIEAAVDWIEARQNRNGFWVGRLETNACMEAEWLLAFHIIGYRHPGTEKILKGILDRQRPDGSWEIYFEAETGDINSTVECYAALRAYGYGPDAPELVRARAWILDNGGLSEVRVFTRYWLALIGEWPWDRTPNVPPEIIRSPLWLPFNIYHFACWARATMLPIAVLSARRPVKPLPPDRRLDELFPGGRENFDYSRRRHTVSGSLWQGVFRVVDRVLHRFQSLHLTPGRDAAIQRCLEWIIRHQDADGAWGGIQPPWIYSVMAVRNEGYALDHPVLQRALATLDEHWSYEKNGALYIQACESPVWDTLLTCLAYQDCGRTPGDSPPYRRALRWLLDRQVLEKGDWSIKLPAVEPGGWAFERANRFYPDLDDTGVALMVLGRAAHQVEDSRRVAAAVERAGKWVRAMQSKGGGWGAFDKDNNKHILTTIPFADFGETLDPPNVDVTAHVLEGLAVSGASGAQSSIDRGVAYLKAEQEADGSWFGRWGVNHIYGTAAVLTAFAALGEDMEAEPAQRAVGWLLGRQNLDGGWGETCASYVNTAHRGRGPSTPSQTAWALMGLLACDPSRNWAAIHRGLDYLVARQQADGTWHEPQYTGTGFPGYGIGARIDPDRSRQALAQGQELSRGFMINYNLYRHYFPMMALGRARRALQRAAWQN